MKDKNSLKSSSILEGLQVCLVEDEPEVANLFIFILEELGADVVRAFSATEALDVLERCQPNLLLCDLRLPDLDGLHLIRWIRERGIDSNELPAIAISSFSREFNHEAVLRAGFQWYLSKPVDLEELTSQILHFARPAS